MSNHAPRLSDVIFGAVDDIVGGLAREADDNSLLDVDSSNSLSNGKGRNDGREETHINGCYVDCFG